MKISEDRIKHMHGVAEYMYRNANKYGLNPEEMYILGLLHDIGYLRGKPDHEVNGAKVLMKSDYKYSSLISWHGTAPLDYMRLKDCTVEDIPKELILLWKADASIDNKGNLVGFDGRLSDVGSRHGYDSAPYRIIEETISWLKDYKKL